MDEMLCEEGDEIQGWRRQSRADGRSVGSKESNRIIKSVTSAEAFLICSGSIGNFLV